MPADAPEIQTTVDMAAQDSLGTALMTTRLLIDTASLTYRAFHALPASITDPDGQPVNAVRGYLDMVSVVAAELGPDMIAHCWDDVEVPEARVAAYPGYKAGRRDAPPEILWQFALLRRLLPALGETIVEAPGWEADDAIGTLCARADAGDRIVVLTGDRDLIQLVRDPVVRVWFTVSGTKKLVRYDEAAVIAAHGVPPQRYVDYAILRGDPSDGLPGLDRVGQKTARRLVAAHATLEEMVAAADDHSASLGRTLRDSTEYVRAMRAVVPVRSDLSLRTTGPDADPALVRRLERAHALSGPIERWQDRRP